MSFADDSDDYRALLDGFLCVLDLEDAALGRAAQVSRALDSKQISSRHVQGDGVIIVVVAKHGEGQPLREDPDEVEDGGVELRVNLEGLTK